jgi:hypothetical protein
MHAASPALQAPAPPPVLQRNILAFARLIEPKRCVGHQKIRVGRDFDGGYILIDDFSGADGALSFGIENDASWDLGMAQRGVPVHQFDHTIESPPAAHPLITFHKLRVAAEDAPGSMRLDTLLAHFLPSAQKAVLKIDIEGDEWPVFANASVETLSKFSQIVCEFHGFHLLSEPGFYNYVLTVMTKLKMLFEVVHVHGNNAHPFVSVSNVMLPRLLEMSLANRRHYLFEETDEIFPTALDQPNLPERPDLHLGCFKF